ncbi:hypothetical protein MJH12_08245 [bacterium]|nr:hypothetical protein [bacterium]
MSKISNSNGFNAQMSSGPSKEKIREKLQSMGVPDEVIKQGRQAVKSWMSENGKESPGMKPSGGAAGQKPSKEQIREKLQSMGVPDEVIKQGRQAVKTWMQENKETTAITEDKDQSLLDSLFPNKEKIKSDSLIDILV